jgi:hypothetical protein
VRRLPGRALQSMQRAARYAAPQRAALHVASGLT